MKLSKFALLAALCGGASASAAEGQQAYYPAVGAGGAQAVPAANCDCGEPICGCEEVVAAAGCDGSCDGLGLCGGGCDSGCGLGLFGDRAIDDPYSLFGEHCGWSAGGWVQLGYHSEALPLFNSRPDEYQLHQAWLYAEKTVDTSGGFDIGGRIDYVYGTDGPDTQAFGIDNDHWDNGWESGENDGEGYGHALPQVYLEAGYGDLTVKAGHFYTIIGYEVVPAPENFFYSHTYTMYNSEPWTHTGALATYDFSDDVELYGGYVLGWNSGFEDNGDAFLGGASLNMDDQWTMTYATVIGRFSDNPALNERGYMHSIVNEYELSDKWQYISQSDVLSTEDEAGNTVRETYGSSNYLLYSVNDCLKLGGRFEWWNVDGDSIGFHGPGTLFQRGDDFPSDFDVYALTLGANYRPHANVIVRPEIRWDWVDGSTDDLAAADFELLENNDDDQTTFGIDTIFTF